MLWAIVLVATACSGAGPMPIPSYDPNLMLRGCAADNQCASGFFCNADKACEINDAGLVPKRSLVADPTWLGFAVALCIGILGFLYVVRRHRAYSWHSPTFDDPDELISQFVNVFVFSAFAGAAVGFGFANILAGPEAVSGTGANCTSLRALACEPYFCDLRRQQCATSCSSDSECLSSTICDSGQCVLRVRDSSVAIPGKTTVLAPWKVGLIVVAISWLTCLAIVIPTEVRYNNREATGREVPASAVAACCAVIVLALVIGVPLGFVSTKVDFSSTPDDPTALSPAGTGPPCKGSRACTPYFCNLDTGTCRTACAADAECISTHSCQSNRCVAKDDSVAPRLITAGSAAAMGVFLGIAVSLFALAFVVCNFDRVAVWAVLLACPCALTVALCASLPGGYALASATPPSENATAHASCAMLDATVCEPYFCDLRSRSCFSTCTRDGDCVPPGECSYGRCVPNSDQKVKPYAVQRWIAGVVGVLLTLGTLAGSCFSTVYCIRYDFDDGKKYFIFPIAACAVLLFIVVMPVAFVTKSTPLPPLPDGDNSTLPCTVLNSGTCFPYYCLVASGRCSDYCTEDAHCREPAGCVKGRCVEPVRRLPLRLAPGLLVVAVALAVGLLVATRMWTWRYTVACLHENGGVFRSVATMSIFVLFVLLFGLVVAFPLGMKNDVVPYSFDGAGLSCAAAADVRCRPYFCDAYARKCYMQCENSRQCVDGYQCDGGVCVAEDNRSNNGMVICACLLVFVLPALLWFVRNGVSLLRGIIARLRRAAHQRRLAALRSWADGQAQIAHVELDVSVPGRSRDPSVPHLRTRAHSSDVSDNEGLYAEYYTRTAESGEESCPSTATGKRPIKKKKKGKKTMKRTGRVKHPTTEESCSICFDKESTVKLAGPSCRHGFCYDCAKEALKEIVEIDQFPARCPGCVADGHVSHDDDIDEKDKGLINSGVVEHLVQRGVLDKTFGQRFIGLQLLKAFGRDEVTSCPACSMLVFIDCGAKELGDDFDGEKELVEPSDSGDVVDSVTKEMQPGKKAGAVKVQCPGCETEFCLTCLCKWFPHQNLSCEEYARKVRKGEDAQTIAFMDKTSKECPRCSQRFVHYWGHACHHIMPGSGCPNCGHHFCCVCLGPHPCTSRDHDTFCDWRCDCPPCPDCRPGQPCPACPGDCPSCRGGPRSSSAESRSEQSTSCIAGSDFLSASSDDAPASNARSNTARANSVPMDYGFALRPGRLNGESEDEDERPAREESSEERTMEWKVLYDARTAVRPGAIAQGSQSAETVESTAPCSS